MVFYRIGAGVFVGIVVPLISPNIIYMAIANGFLRPHLAFRILKQKRGPYVATSTQMLDTYLKDVFSSILLFPFVLVPLAY